MEDLNANEKHGAQTGRNGTAKAGIFDDRNIEKFVKKHLFTSEKRMMDCSASSEVVQEHGF